MSKKILGLDLGTNSIGWALIDRENQKILGMGSRIVPMGDDKGNFESGKKMTRNADRRMARGVRRGNHRYKLRRNKLLFALWKLGMLPDLISFGYYTITETGEKEKINFQFPDPCKIQKVFVEPIRKGQKQNKKDKYLKDTAQYILELRKEALEREVSLKDMGRIFYLLNQLRGYSGGGDDNEKDTISKEGENISEKKLVAPILITNIKIVADVGLKDNGKGEPKIKITKYKITLLTNKDSAEYIEGFAYKALCVDDNNEIQIKNIKQNEEHKTNHFEIDDAEISWGNLSVKNGEVFEQVVKGFVTACEPAIQLHKNKAIYAIIGNYENEEVEGNLYIESRKLDKINLDGSQTELEITIKTDSNNGKTYSFALPNETNWRKNLKNIEKEITEKQNERKEQQILDANGNGNYHICHYFLDKIVAKKPKETVRTRNNVILRKRYEAEFDAIWEKQTQCNEDFKKLVENKELLNELVQYIFPGKK